MQLHVVDVFTDIPSNGNPAVCFLEGTATDFIQAVAARFISSATAFLRETDGGWGLR